MRAFLALVTLTLTLALVACGGKQGPAKPVVPGPSGPITAASLEAYFSARFPAAIADGTLKLEYGDASTVDQTVAELGGELAALGITDMSALAAIVPNDYDTKGFGAVKASDDPTTNIAGILRDFMLIHDTRGYVTKAWKQHWTGMGPEEFPAPAAYGIDFSIMEEAGVFGGGDPCGYGEDGYDGEGDPCGGDPCGD